MRHGDVLRVGVDGPPELTYVDAAEPPLGRVVNLALRLSGAQVYEALIMLYLGLYVDELILGIIGVLVTVVTSIATIAYWLGRKFQKIESDIKNIYEVIEIKHNDLKAYINNRIKDLQKEFREDVARLSLGFQSYQEFL